MATGTGASVVSCSYSPTFRLHEVMSSGGNLKSNRIPGKTWRLAVSMEQVPAISMNSAKKRRLELEIQEKETENTGRSSAAAEECRSGAKDYFEQSRDFIKSNGGPPRWFSPLECASRLDNAPLLLFLPGIDGMGLGLLLHHQKLGRIFDVWCLHIPVRDRTPCTDLVEMVETTVRLEHQRSPNRPIYLVGDSLGGCLALAVAARNPDTDLVLILANPATSFRMTQLPLLIPFLDATPGPLSSLPMLPNIFSLMEGDPFGPALDSLLKLPLPKTARELTEGLATLSSTLAVLADILPRETLLWKLHLLESASEYANSLLHAIKAQTLILSSGKDQLLPSKEEGERLSNLLPRCELRRFNDSGHFLLLEKSFDLVTVIKGTSYYRRGKIHDYGLDFIPPTPDEIKQLANSYRWEWWESVASAVMLSTMEDGTIVRGLGGIPSEGPVLFVGYHMLLGIEVIPLVFQIFLERNILVRGIAHPSLFTKSKYRGILPLLDVSTYDAIRIMGAVPVAATNLFRLFSSNSHVLLYPGGMREACHRKGEEYKLFWPQQSEFVRMAARFGAKIVPFGTVGEDDFAQVVIDYDDLTKIPYLKNELEKLTNASASVRNNATGEVGNQQMHLPGILPKFPGRFYYYFGKPIETQGRDEELKDREKANELYLQVKSKVENCLAYLKEKRGSDPYRNILPRLFYQATHAPSSQVPTFEI